MNEITAALHLIAAAWPGKVQPEQLDLWRAAIAEHTERVPPGTIAQAAKALVVTGGPFPPSLGEFLDRILGITDVAPAEVAWINKQGPLAEAATRSVGRWNMDHTTRPDILRRDWIKAYNAARDTWRESVILGTTPAPAETNGAIELPAAFEPQPRTWGFDVLSMAATNETERVDPRPVIADIRANLRTGSD